MPGLAPPKRGREFEQWIEGHLRPSCEELGLHLETQKRLRKGKAIPDFVIYSRKRNRAVVIDAKAYHDRLRKEEVVKLRRDMTALKEEEGVTVVGGLLYCYKDTAIPKASREEAASSDDVWLVQCGKWEVDGNGKGLVMLPHDIAFAVFGLFYRKEK